MRSQTTEQLAATRTTTSPAPPTIKRRRRWPFWLGGCGLILVAAVLLAPTIIAKTPLRQQVLPWAVPGLDCRVRIGSASLGWFSPIALNDVVVSDSAAQPIAVVGEVRSEKTLWGLISDTSQLGRFDIRRPQVHVVLREDGNNLQDVLAPLFEPTDRPPAALGVQLRVTEGRVLVTDQTRGRSLQVVDLRLDLDKPLAADQPLTSILEGKLQSGTEPGRQGDHSSGAVAPGGNLSPTAASPLFAEAGSVRADVTWKLPADAATEGLGRGQVKLALNSVALAAAKPLLDRFAPGIQLGGRVSSDLTLGFQGSLVQPAAEVTGWINADGLTLFAPAWLGEDQLGSNTVRLSGRVALVNGRLLASQTGFESDVARLQVHGSAPVAQLAEKPWLTWLAETLQSDDYQLEGDIDLARLAAMLPHTLRLREGTEITSGRVMFQMQGLVSEGRRAWVGAVHTEQLAGTANGRPISWEDPLEVSFAAHQSDQGPMVDKLVCQAEFLQVQASGNLREATVTLDGSLDKLTAELNRFFDLGALQMAGTFGGKLTCLHPQEDRLQAVGVVRVDSLRLSLPGGGTLSEPRVDVTLSALGVGDDTGLKSIEQLEFNLVTDSGTAAVQLAQPVETVSWDSSWPLAARVSGDLQHWLNRLRPWLPTNGWDISGQTEMTGQVWVSPDKIFVQQGTVDVTQLHAHGPGLYIDEPHVRLETSCTWDRLARQLTAPTLTLVAGNTGGPAGDSIAVDLRADDVTVQLAEPGPPQLVGNVAFRGALERFAQWITDPQSTPKQYLAGQVNGRANLVHAGAQTRGQWSASIDNLVYATLQTTAPARAARRPGSVSPASATARWEPVWQERQVTVEGQADYHFAADSLRVDKLAVTSEMLQLTAAGTIDELGGRRLTNLKGDVEYDLNHVTTRLAPLVGPQITLSGRQRRSFSVRGPLEFSPSVAAHGSQQPAGTRLASRVAPAEGLVWPQDLTGAAGFGWTAADLYGLRAGEGNLEAQLADGVVTAPLDLTINGGRIRCVSRIALGQSPMTLLIDPGLAVENVQITDQMSATWLKFVAPFFADATRIDGRFSLDLQQARVPLAEPATGDVAGTLQIHSARLRPGPLFDQFVFLAQQIRALIELRPLPQAGTVPQSGLVEIDPQAVPFQMVNGRVYHRDLTLNVRGVRIRTSGSVGLDQSLDLMAEIPILPEWAGRQSVLASLSGQTLKIPVRGRLGQPNLDDRALRQVARGAAESAAGRLIEQGLDRALEGIFRPGGTGNP